MEAASKLVLWFYRQPLPGIMVSAVVACTLFGFARSRCVAKKCWNYLAAAGLAAGIALILLLTMGRGSANARLQPELLPLHTYRAVLQGGRLEILRMNFMNTILVFPAGLFFCELLPAKWSGRLRGMLVVICLCLLCAGIEYCQYRFAMGQAEIDDVIHNTLGALMGVLIDETLRILPGRIKFPGRKGIEMKHRNGFYEKYIKRLMDILLSGGALIVLSPVLLVTAVLVRRKLGSPVIFCQPRPGRNEKIFKLYKFRSMTDEKDEDGNLLPDEIRLTKFGKLLRSTSLDELPELWNILRGDMSIVGPRPLLVKYLPLYNEEQKHRHDVRPGLTGWAQVHGRNALSWEEKFRLDLWYVENISFLVDMKTIFLTVKKVFCREGISSETAATMEEFKGTKETDHG